MNLLAHASVGLTGAVSMVDRGAAVEVRDMVDRLVYRHDLAAEAADCYRRLRDGYAYAGEVVTEQGESEPLPAYATRHARALHDAMRRAAEPRRATATAVVAEEIARRFNLARLPVCAALIRVSVDNFGPKRDALFVMPLQNADERLAVAVACVRDFETWGAAQALLAADGSDEDPWAYIERLAREQGVEIIDPTAPSVTRAAPVAPPLVMNAVQFAAIGMDTDVVSCGAGLDAHIEPVPGCTQGRVVATLRERATGRMAHRLAFGEGATRDEAVRAAVEALRAALATSPAVQP